MAERGRLEKKGNGFSLISEKKNKSGLQQTYSPASGCISDDILREFETSRITSLDVEFDLQSGQPRNIRLPGGAFIPPSTSSTNSRNAGNQGRQETMNPRYGQGNRHGNEVPGHGFHNPYNFVPALPRNTSDQDLGDHPPARHDRFEPDLYSGSITITMETVTPLLIPDAEHATTNGAGHTTFDMLTDDQGRPLIPASSVRGMLRSAYEIITNSRFSKFPKETHSKRLGYRIPPENCLNFKPVRIIERNDGIFAQELESAWLPMYLSTASSCIKHGDFKHGEEAWAWIQEFTHPRGFRVYRVLEISKQRGNLPSFKPGVVRTWGNLSPTGSSPILVKGYVFITNQNFSRKHDERFFYPKNGASFIKITDEVKKKYEDLIQHSQDLHKDEIINREQHGQKPETFLGKKPGETAWSSHVYKSEYCKLKHGDLCYARIEGRTIKMLYPVSISRDLQEASPWDLLDESLRPAESLEQLSPVDRVFGWVNPDSDKPADQKDAWRGLLRLSPVQCLNGENSIQKFQNGGVPLAILASPKPQQARFYVAQNKYGIPLPDGISKKEAQYKHGYALRGRKVYPHHATLPDGYWDNPLADRTQQRGANNWYQEYRRPQKDGEEQRDSQNRSISAWINPETRFQFDIQFMNLSEVELGALLWLLSLNKDGGGNRAKRCLRLGAGKPLGFGSVTLSIESACFAKGSEMIKKYKGWNSRLENLSPENFDSLINKYKEAMVKFIRQGQKPFDDLPCIKCIPNLLFLQF